MASERIGGWLLSGALALFGCSATDTDTAESGSSEPGDDLAWAEGKADGADPASVEKAFSSTDTVSCANAAGLLPPFDAGAGGTWLTRDTPHFFVQYKKTGADRVAAAWLDLSPHNGHPDFVDAVAEGAEQAHSRFVGELGYPDPGKTTIYLKDADGYFGYMSQGVVVVDNDSYAFKISRHFLRATVAHEYFHVLQAELAENWSEQDHWLTESSAVWAEQDAMDLWGGFVGGFVRDTVVAGRLKQGVHRSLLNNDPVFAANLGYATYLFEQFLVERTGDPGVVKRLFELMGQGQSALGATDQMLNERGLDLESTFREWTAWNYLIGSRDDGKHYSDGKSVFHGLASSHVEKTFSSPPSAWQTTSTPPELLAANYVEVGIAKGTTSLHLEIDPLGKQRMGLTTLGRHRTDGKWSTIHHPAADGASALDLDVSALDRVVLVVQHLLSDDVSVSQKPVAYRYRATPK